MTGGRIKRAQHLLQEDVFMMTYGDGLSDINLAKLLEFHKSKGKLATVTGIKKKSQYGTLTVKNDVAASYMRRKNI